MTQSTSPLKNSLVPILSRPRAKDSLDNFTQFLGSADVSYHVTMQSCSKTIHLRTRQLHYHDDNMAANFV